MVARFLPAAHIAIDARRPQSRGKSGTQQQVIDAQTGVPAISVAEVVPEGINHLLRVQRTQCISPALRKQILEGLTDLRPEQSVVDPPFRLIDVLLGRDYVVITSEYGRFAAGYQIACMTRQASNPAQLVIELGPWRRIAVRQIKITNEDATDAGFDITAVRVIRVSGSALRLSSGCAPRARMATPFQLFWPCQITP